jgi:RHS repeat-associated protein
LGSIAEQTNAWSYGLPDGTNTQRQLTDADGEVTLAARYTPWGDTLESYGAGNLTFGYFGGLMDAATGLLYVGNGQYYDPGTGRFLTRAARPEQSNPYVPWDPTGALLAPLGLLAVIFNRRRKVGKRTLWITALLVVGTMSMGLSACELNARDIGITPSNVPLPLDAVIIQTQTAIAAVVQAGNQTVVAAATPSPTLTLPDCPEAPPISTPFPMHTSGYYIPTEAQAKKRDGGIAFPIPAPTWLEDKDTYLIEYHSVKPAADEGDFWSKNWAGGWPAQYANEFLMYDYNYTCLQGTGKLNIGHYIACDTLYTWSNLFLDDANHTREDLIGFRWASEAEGGLLETLKPFKTVAVCGTSTLKGTIQVFGLPEAAMNKLRENGNQDAVFEVKDIGSGLCPANNPDGKNYIDVYTGVGEAAYEDAVLFFDKPVQVAQH